MFNENPTCNSSPQKYPWTYAQQEPMNVYELFSWCSKWPITCLYSAVPCNNTTFFIHLLLYDSQRKCQEILLVLWSTLIIYCSMISFCQLGWVVFRSIWVVGDRYLEYHHTKIFSVCVFFPGGQDPSPSTKRVAEKLHNQNRIDGIETTYGVKIQ